MALIAIAADKGAPGVTTASVALGAVWPRPVLLAECDPSGGDLVYRLPAADGGRLDPRRGLLSLAVAARRGLQPHQVWEHSQKLHGGLDILAGVNGAEQGAGLELLWGAVGRLFTTVPQADVIADCGRVGVDGPVYDLLASADSVVLLTRASLGEVVRLRDRAAALGVALKKRGRFSTRIDVVVVADYKNISSAAEEVRQALQQSGSVARVVGGLAYEPKSADQLRGEWGGKLDKSMFIRTARAIASELVSGLPELGRSPASPDHPAASPAAAAPMATPQGQGSRQPPSPYRPASAGPTGAAGPAGPAGPTGAAGPAGSPMHRPSAPTPAPAQNPRPYPSPAGQQTPTELIPGKPYRGTPPTSTPPPSTPPSGSRPTAPRTPMIPPGPQRPPADAAPPPSAPGSSSTRGRHASARDDRKSAQAQPPREEDQQPAPNGKPGGR